MKQVIFLVIGASEDTLVLNGELTDFEGALHCWTPDRKLYELKVLGVRGSIVEIDRIASQENTQIPCGSLAISSDEDFEDWYVDKYVRGCFNKSIVTVMNAYGVQDFKLPAS